MEQSMTYDEWIYKVNRILLGLIGMSTRDLEDWLSRDTYDSGATPAEGAEECLRSQDMPEFMIDEAIEELYNKYGDQE